MARDMVNLNGLVLYRHDFVTALVVEAIKMIELLLEQSLG